MLADLTGFINLDAALIICPEKIVDCDSEQCLFFEQNMKDWDDRIKIHISDVYNPTEPTILIQRIQSFTSNQLYHFYCSISNDI